MDDGGSGDLGEVELASYSHLLKKSLKRSLDMFVGNRGARVAEWKIPSERRKAFKIEDEYAFLPDIRPRVGETGGDASAPSAPPKSLKAASSDTSRAITAGALVPASDGRQTPAQSGQSRIRATAASETNTLQLSVRRPNAVPEPVWHPPWKLMRVISGHQGWVRALAVDPSNEWFVSSGNDRLIKIWDLASGILKLTLTGHINTVRGLAISPRQPYLFSCAEDNQVKCWDLEQNKVVRHYHGHLSGVYALALHPDLDVLATGGRDAVVRVWDIRTKHAVHVLAGHHGTVMSLLSQAHDPQIISGSMDKTVRCWDLAAGKLHTVLTNHKKSIRALVAHPREYTFLSAGTDNLKLWKCPEATFERNFEPAPAIVNTACVQDNPESSVLVGGTDQGHLCFWDWRSGHNFQTIETKPQPGSLSSENGIFQAVFDKSETRLLTAECDKTIKIWKEDADATPESHPVNWKPPKNVRRY